MSRWVTYLLLGGLIALLYLAPGPFQGHGALFALISVSPLIAIAVGLRVCGPAVRTAALLLAAGGVANLFGDLYLFSFPPGEAPFPSLADLAYLARYPLMLAGLLQLVHRRGGQDRSGLIDSLILTVGLALPSWVVLIAPYLRQDDLELLPKLVSVAYPLGDILLLAAAARLALDQGRRDPAFVLLIGSLLLLLAGDFAYGMLTLHGVSTPQPWLDATWIACLLCFGAAALHPSMARLAEPAPRRAWLLTRTRLVLLTGAALIAPVITGVHHLREREFGYLVVDASSLVLFGLVIVRMEGLARRQRVLSEELHRRRGEERFAALVRHSTDMLTVLAPDGSIKYTSPSVYRLLGDDPSSAVTLEHDRLRFAEGLAAVIAGQEVAPLECTVIDREGQRRVFEVRMTNLIEEEHVGGILLNARDVSERKAFEAELTHQAFHDPVTGLANRAWFVERVRDAIARALRTGGSLAVIFVDLDDFKTINDSLGHAAGDVVLTEIARRLDGGVRGGDAAARFGGDEFAVLLEGAGSQDAADAAQRILDALAVPVQAAGRAVSVHASVGISVALADDARGAEELIRDADAAMYVAKRDGKGGYRLFEPAMHAGVLARLELRTDLERALSAGEFELHYQPVVELQDGGVTGFEALLRWRHPERGLISPADFIPAAEETGLIVPIGRWVLHEAAAHARAIGGDLRMNVNLSARQLQDPRLIDDVRAAIDGLEPSRFVLELTESMLMEDADLAVETLSALKALGVRIALDDFGTGYSSLGYLSRFPVDVLKLDRSFLTQGSPELIAGVVGLGQALALDIVAEGIEEEEQWRALRALGCHYGQGFLFSRPLSAADSLAAVL